MKPWVWLLLGAVSAIILTLVIYPLGKVQSSPSFETLSGGTRLDRGIFINPMSDGGYAAVGFTQSFGAGGEDVYLVRTDAAGEVLWSNTYGGAREDNGWSVHETEDGLIIAGFTQSFGAGGFDCYLIQTDTLSEEQWSNTFGGTGNDRCWAMLILDDGGFVLLGETTSFGNGAEDCYLIKIDADGNEVWSTTFGGTRADRCFSLAQVDDGGFMLAGQTFSEGAGNRDAFVIRTDQDGNELWSQTFGGRDSDVAHWISKTSEGNFFVTGYTSSFAESGEAPYLHKINADGELNWTKVIQLEASTRAITGEQTTDGGFIVGGFTSNTRPSSAVLVKVDESGELEWTKDFFSTSSGQSLGYTVRATSDGGSVLTGHTSVDGSGGFDLFILKLDSNGEF